MKSKESSSPQGIPRLLHTVAGFIFVFLFFCLAAFRVVFSLLAFVFDVSHIRVQKAKKEKKKKKLDLSYMHQSQVVVAVVVVTKTGAYI